MRLAPVKLHKCLEWKRNPEHAECGHPGFNLSKEIQSTALDSFFLIQARTVLFLQFYSFFLGLASFLFDSNAPVVGREKEEKGQRREMFVGFFFCHVCAFCLCILQTSLMLTALTTLLFNIFSPAIPFHIYSQLELIIAFGATSVSLIKWTLLQENMCGNDTAHVGSAALFGSWPE